MNRSPLKQQRGVRCWDQHSSGVHIAAQVVVVAGVVVVEAALTLLLRLLLLLLSTRTLVMTRPNEDQNFSS